MNYIISFLLIGVLGFVIVKNIIAIVNKVKENRSKKNNNDIVEVDGVDNLNDIDNK